MYECTAKRASALRLRDFVEPILVKVFRRFSGLFWPNFDFFRGAIYELILTPEKSRNLDQKNQKID
jgi:hypothetical protein